MRPVHARQVRLGRLVAVALVLLPAGVVGRAERVDSAHREGFGLTPFVDPLPVPPVVDATRGGVVDLRLRAGVHSFSPGNRLPATTTWGYSAQLRDGRLAPVGGVAAMPYLGPTIEARRGTPITVRAFNELGKHPATTWCPTSTAGCDPVGGAIDLSLHGTSPTDMIAPRAAVHKHGGHVPPGSDGGPLATFGPGRGKRPGWTYEYVNDQEATTLWYHDHALGITRLNVVAGLAGFYLLRDDFDTGRPGNRLGLPSGAYELPIVLQDRQLRADGSVVYPAGPLQPWSPEYFGDVAVVNGVAFPYAALEPRIYRLRLLNGSNARVYRLAVDDARQQAAMYQIGTDGGLLAAPVRLSALVLAPGERADVLLDLRTSLPGDVVTITNNAPTPYPGGARAARRGGTPLRQLLQVRVASPAIAGPGPGAVAALPTALRGDGGAPALPAAATLAAAASRTRTVFLNEILDPATGAPLEVLLNNTRFAAAHETDGLQERPAPDTVEVWNIVNVSADTHPIHFHLAQLQVLARQPIDAAGYLATLGAMQRAAGFTPSDCTGLPAPCAAGVGPPYLDGDDRVEPPAPVPVGPPVRPAANEVGWKDTVQAHPGEVTSVVVPFGGDALAAKLGLEGSALPYTGTFSGDYVLHCHILEHEDNDMMLPFTVE